MPMLTMFHPEAANLSASAAAKQTSPPVAPTTPKQTAPQGVGPARPVSPGSVPGGSVPAPVGLTRVGLAGGGGNAANPFVEVAARLLSETAHDLRSPLTSVRELVRLVYDGDLGATTSDQREMLGEALGQCDAIASLIDNMLQLDRLRSGLPRTRRRWIAPTAIPALVDAAIRSVATARQIGIRWDGFDGRHGPIFGDEQLIHRLLVNLLCNAIAVSPEGRSVLVRLRPSVADGSVLVSVCDQGPGVSVERFTGMAERGVSGTGGFGLGLAISRTLAALHFSRLFIQSKPGEGTQISFELPAAGPASVADALVGWRELSVAPPPVLAPISPAERRVPGQTRAVGESQRDVNEGRRAIPFDGPPPRFPASAIILTLRVVGTRVASRTSRELEAIDDLLQSDQRLHELVYRTDASRWVLLWDNTLEEARRRIASVESQMRKNAADLDLVWSESAEQPIAGRANRTRIREWLVRDMLQASSRPVIGHDRSGRTQDPSAESIDVASRRLDEELLRLSHRLRHQTNQLQRQADRLAGALKG